MAHEAGHVIELENVILSYAKGHGISFADACKNSEIIDLIGWERKLGTPYAQSVFEKIQKQYILKYGKNISMTGLVGKISYTASTSFSECIAEAVHDFYINGNNANEISIMIVKEIGLF